MFGARSSHSIRYAKQETRCCRQVPQTIEDAIRVVLNLGYRYLWVDRFCIDQENGSQDRHQQIEQMDLVFEHALTTIVATGPGADAGLHGVSVLPRKPQPYLALPQGLLISTMPGLSSYLEVSKWSSRGWTYQEALLSHGCLVFTESQVYYTCKTRTSAEAMGTLALLSPSKQTGPTRPRELWAALSDVCNAQGLGQVSSSKLGPQMFNSKLQMKRSGQIPRIPLLLDQLSEYTSRSLTYESDALNAVKGILARFTTRSYWGIPIGTVMPLVNQHLQSNQNMHDTAGAEFAHGLLWLSRSWNSFRGMQLARVSCNEPSPTGRRQDFPSWSWASARGIVTFPEVEEVRARPSKVSAMVHVTYHMIFSIKNAENRWEFLKDALLKADLSGRSTLPEYSSHLRCSSRLATCHFETTNGHSYRLVDNGSIDYNGYIESFRRKPADYLATAVPTDPDI